MTGHTKKQTGIKALFIECPHCYTRVLPTTEMICPACRKDIRDTYDVNPDMASLTVLELQELPPYCYRCNSYTDRYVLLEGDQESLLSRSIRKLGSLFVPHRVEETDKGTTNVYIHLPQCETCAELEEPTPVYVDYDSQSMTFIVHKDFRERVQPIPVEDEDKDGEEEENIEQ